MIEILIFSPTVNVGHSYLFYMLKRVDDMCNLSAVVEEKGINALVNTLKGLQISNDVIISNLMKEFGLSETEAKKYLY